MTALTAAGIRRRAGECALYILMRNDLVSLNPGKACAQASHASNAFIARWERMPAANRRAWAPAVAAWQSETRQGFGPVVVKAGPLADIAKSLKEARRRGLIASFVNDPEYPLRDGDFLHLIPLDTCAYVFGPRDIVRECPVLGAMPWMP